MVARYVAEIVQSRGCFSLRPRRPPTLEVLTEACAAARVQDGTPAIVWLDVHAEAVLLTERWGADVVTQRLPLQLDVVQLPQPVAVSPEEYVVATIAFADHASLELFVKLGLHVLPDWLSIRRSALGTNMLVASGYWLISYHGQAVKLQSSDGSLVGLLQLNLCRPCVELLILQHNQLLRLEAVKSLGMASKALSKHDGQKPRLIKSVQHTVQHLQPYLLQVQKLKEQLQASAEQRPGAAHMYCWIDVGIVAALTDCATSIPHHEQQLLQQQEQQKCRQVPTPCARSSAVLMLMNSIGACICEVLLHAGEQASQQAQLLMSCITRGLCGSVGQAVMAATLLLTVLEHLTDSDGAVWEPLRKELQGPALLHQLLHCCSSAQAFLQSTAAACKVSTPGERLQSHPLAAAQDCVADDPGVCQWALATEPCTPSSSDPGGAGHKKPLVPRLPLPSLGGMSPPTAIRSSRLSRRASEVNSSTCQAERPSASADTRQSSAASSAALLQQLGHSCGESVMAADLAAFVTHKQLHTSQAFSNTQSAWALLSAETEALALIQAPEQLSFEQLCGLPCEVQLQVQSLECLHMLVQQLPADYPLPAGLGCMLCQLLLSQSLMEHRTERQDQQHPQLLGQGVQRQRDVAVQLLVRCVTGSQPWPSGDTSSMPGPLHGNILAQFKHHLMHLTSVKRPGGWVHAACRDALLLLRDYLLLLGLPGLVETTCCVLGHALGQLEHMLRATRVPLWSWDAVQHMDALVQVYLALAGKASTASAASHLLQILGAQLVLSTPRGSCTRAASSIGGSMASSPGAAAAQVAADSLALVVDFLQNSPLTGQPSAQSSRCSPSVSSPAAHTALQEATKLEMYQPASVGGRRSAGAANTIPLSASMLADSGRATGSASGAGTPLLAGTATQLLCGYMGSQADAAEAAAAAPSAAEATTIKGHCWQLLASMLELMAKCHTGKLAGGVSTPSSSASWYEVSSLGCSTSSGSEGLPRASAARSAAAAPQRISGSCSSTSGGAEVLDGVESRSAASSGRLGMPLTAQQSSAPSSSAGGASVAGMAAANSSEVPKFLVELLMRQRSGRPYAVRQLDELDGSQAALPLQLEILNFVAKAYTLADAYPLMVPQLTEFYVHYHFLHFTRHYYKLPTSPSLTVLACCKGHVKVLLALCRHTGGANLVRRRFLQLKVLDFLVRELSVEHNLKALQTGGFNSSCCSTPHSTAYSQASGRALAALAAASAWTARGLGSAAGVEEQEQAVPAHVVEDHTALTERGLSGLLTSSFSSVQPAEASAVQLGRTEAWHLQQQELLAAADIAACTAADVSGSSLYPTSALACSSSSPVSAQGVVQLSPTSGQKGALQIQRQADKSLDIVCTPVRGSVLSAVRLFEAAAAAAAQSPPASVPAPAAGSPAGCGQRSSKQVAPVVAAATPTVTSNLGYEQQACLSPVASQSPDAWSMSCTAGVGTTEMTAGVLRNGGLVYEQPQLTGDASFDGQLIEAWEEQTGLAFAFNGLSREGSEVTAGEEEEGEGFEGLCEYGSTESLDGRRSSQQGVPRLALGGAALALQVTACPAGTGGLSARPDSARSEGSAASYRPGLDLEEDFERLMSAEESGRQATFDFSDEDSSSDCSGFIAAGRDMQEQPGQQLDQPGSAALNGTVAHAQPARLQPAQPLQAEAVLKPDSFAGDEPSSSSDTRSCRGDAGTRRCGNPKVLPVSSEAAQAAAHTHIAADHACGSIASLCEDMCLVDSVDMRAASPSTEAQAAGSTGLARRSRPLDGRAVVPHLRLPTDQHAAQTAAAYNAAVLSSRSSIGSGPSPAAKQCVPSLMAAATPLLTSRIDGHAAARRSSYTAAACQGSELLTSCSEAGAESSRSAAAPAAAAAAGACGSSVYQAHRRVHAVYADRDLHVLCLELALHLLGTPAGSLDPLQLPQEPTDNSLQHKVMVLLDHLSHADNAEVLSTLESRARSQLHCQGRCTAAAAATACEAAACAVGVPSLECCTADGSAVSAAARVTSGLAGCTLRLMKLLSPSLLDIGRLQLGATIQQGAFSEVKAAMLLHASRQQPVAVKVLDAGSNESTCFERVYNEVTILDSLHGHKGVVPLLDYGVTCSNSSSSSSAGQQPQWLLVFPRYSGSLRGWRLLRGQGLDQEDLGLYLRIFMQVVSTVRDLHAANIVHYDIKGDNLLLDASCQDSLSVPFEVVLADFGDALMFDSSGAAYAQRHRGTELFSSPEMLLLHAGQQNPGHEQHDRRRHRGVGHAHDIWSLGCTLYELLTGKVLFEEEGVGRITSYAPTGSVGSHLSAAGRQRTAADAALFGGGCVLRSHERDALGGHAGVIELLEFMLVGDASWRPGAAEVLYKVQRLLAAC